ncbi:MAG: GNAT family N-acetyltransferase [candidate division FCPU426 bacterium]
MSPAFNIHFATSDLDIEQVRDLRRSVLCGEFHWPRELVEDPVDRSSILALATLGPKPVGCARLCQRGSTWHIEVLAVLERQRGQGLGKAILATLEGRARNAGASSLRVLCPPDLSPYFERQGYQGTEEASVLEKDLGKRL